MKYIQNSDKKNQSGIALIFSLSILALLLFIGVSFLTIGMSEKTNSIASLDDAQARMIAEAGASRAHAILTHDLLRNIYPTLGRTTAGRNEDQAKKQQTLSNPFVSRAIEKGENAANDIDACDALYKDDGLKELLNIQDFQELGYFEDGKNPTPEWNYIVEPVPHGEPMEGGYKESDRNVIGRFAFIGLQRYMVPFTSVKSDEMREKITKTIDPSLFSRVGNSPIEIPGALDDYFKYIDNSIFTEEDKVRLKREFDVKTPGEYLDVSADGGNKIFQWPDMQAFASVVKDIQGDAITTKDLIKFLPFITSTSSTAPSNESFKLYNAPIPLSSNKDESDGKKRYAIYHKFNIGRTPQAWSYKRQGTDRFWSGLPARAYGGMGNHNDYFFHRSPMWWAMDPPSRNNAITEDRNKLAGMVPPAYAGLLWKKEKDEFDDVKITIPYISGMEITPEAKTLGYGKSSDLRVQMMANLKDYCDQYREQANLPKATHVADAGSDDRLSDDVALGVETTPLINEVRFNIEVAYDKTDPEKPKTILRLEGLDAEFCKMYVTTNIAEYVSQFVFKIEVQFDNGRTEQFNSTDYWAHRNHVTIGNVPDNMGGYEMNSIPVDPYAGGGSGAKNLITLEGKKGETLPKPVKITLTNAEVQITPKGTSNQNEACNFARLPRASFNLNQKLDNDGDGVVLGFQVDDPRMTLKREAWMVRDDNDDMERYGNYLESYTGRGIQDAGTWLKKNKNCSVGKPTSSFGWDADPEGDAYEPWQISTAYIRNASMRSLWELGFIHRIAPWQSINLKRYAPMNEDPENQFMRISNEGYKAGDARILDQVKLGRQTQTYGKINMNKATRESLMVLFAGVKMGSDPTTSTNRTPEIIIPNGDRDKENYEYLEGPYTDVGNKNNYYSYSVLRQDEDPMEYKGNVLSKDQAVRFSDEILRLRSVTKSQYDTFKEALPEILSEASKTILNTTKDAQLEEAIGKTFPLIDEDASYEMAVLVVGQSIRDVGKKGVFEGPHKDGVMGTQKMLYIYTYVPNDDPMKSKWVVTRKIYLND